MGREIKFRAYDKKAGEWTIPTTCTQGNKLFVGFLDREDVIVMQYIGLKDSKGKEIYEGDIIRVGNYLCEVFYNEKYCSFEMRDEMGFMCFNEQYVNSYEVIGNRWDNPELLEGTNKRNKI